MSQVLRIPRLANELLFFIYDYLENNENRLSLVLSDTLFGFEAVYKQKIRYTFTLIIAEHNLKLNIFIFMSDFQYHSRGVYQL